MACKGCLECLLKLLNFILTLLGLAMVGYGIYLFVIYNKSTSSSSSNDSISEAISSNDMMISSRPMLIGLSLSSSFIDNIPKAWFICVFVGVGFVLFVVSCFGCIGATTRNRCCLTSYAVLVILLILIQLGCAAFIFFDKSWIDEIPTDNTGDFDMIYDFLDENWDIIKWVALGFVIFEAVLFVLALIVRATNKPVEYDSDEEYIGGERQQQNRQPLINRQPAPPATGVLVNTASRNDAWSTRMREKYGLDTSEFTYNPADPTRTQAAEGTQAQTEEKRCCAIM
ncbi:tobamovirus multiplication protein 2A-like [Impatiens glandulifera]|uniref:tobamovirus multiplication protein 2A-like n=1 Tax=Impatiens glandulifera TaxID=253017 RepID=UPI001FB176DF|nr:tobamovirus multiplication protein 2A-like [Impatiens glandulifera]